MVLPFLNTGVRFSLAHFSGIEVPCQIEVRSLKTNRLGLASDLVYRLYLFLYSTITFNAPIGKSFGTHVLWFCNFRNNFLTSLYAMSSFECCNIGQVLILSSISTSNVMYLSAEDGSKMFSNNLGVFFVVFGQSAIPFSFPLYPMLNLGVFHLFNFLCLLFEPY